MKIYHVCPRSNGDGTRLRVRVRVSKARPWEGGFREGVRGGRRVDVAPVPKRARGGPARRPGPSLFLLETACLYALLSSPLSRQPYSNSARLLWGEGGGTRLTSARARAHISCILTAMYCEAPRARRSARALLNPAAKAAAKVPKIKSAEWYI